MSRWIPLLSVALMAGSGLHSPGAQSDCLTGEAGFVLPGRDDNPCPGSDLLLRFDGTGEAACSWQGDGVLPPDYGAWAEGYTATGLVCGIQFHFSALTGWQTGQNLDAYVYDSDGENPSAVLSMTPGIDPGPVAIWPALSSHDIDTEDVEVGGEFFAGFWGAWPGEFPPGWGTVCDLDGPQGMPRTKIAPGIGYPTGWHDPSIVFGPTRNNAIGPYVAPLPIPASGSTWGSVKMLYR